VSPDRIDHSGLLVDEQIARAMEHQAAPLLGGLGRNELHVGPGDRFVDVPTQSTVLYCEISGALIRND